MTPTLLPSLAAIEDILFNFAQSDGLSQANPVNSARNQGLTATVVFLDAGVTDYQSLQAGVIPEVATVILTPNQDGIEQITAFLQQNPQITTIHLISHGAPGCLYLGNCQLNLTNIYDYRQKLQNWAKINHILLYGCQVAAGDAGTEFISKLSQITGAKIAASSRRVGNAALGGSWELEVSFPAIKGENQTFVETSDLSDLQTSGVFQPDILNTYPGVFAPTLVGVWDRLSVAYGVTVVGNYAYAVGDTLEIIDISNPSNPTFKGNYDIYEGQDVQIVGNYAYLADWDSGLQIIDISNPTNPTLKGNYNTSGTARGVQIVGNYGYVADGFSGLQIIDISNPTTPTLKGNYNTSGTARGVQIVGNYAYLADGDSGLQIIDISNPTNPTLKGNYDTSGTARGVQIVGNYAYVTDSWSGLQIIDISNPTNPTLKGYYYTPGDAFGVQVVGNYAYVADGLSGLQIIDISNPTNPTFKGNYHTYWVYDVQIVGNYAYVADWGSGLQIVDISNPTNPTLKGNYDTSFADGVQIVGNYAYLADGGSGLQIIDISNPTNPTLKGNYDTSGNASGVQIVGNYAYVADWDSGLQIIDISNPTNPTLKGNYDTSGYADGVQIVGNYAYLADGGSGLQIIDISNPTNPILVGKYSTSGAANGVQIVGNYAYVADSDSGLQIIDISNPTNPTLKGNYDTSGYAYDVQIVGNYAYVADYTSGLQIIDISNPTNPTLKGNYNTSGYARDVQVVGNYAYVADDTSGLQIINISNPAAPTLVGNYDTSGYANDVQVVGKYAYLADGDGGLKIIDVSEFTNPQTVTVTLSISPSSVSEDGTANMAYTFTRSGVTTNALTVNYTVGGTATFSTDYTQSGAATFTSTTGTVTFAAGSTTAKVTIDPTADTIVEPNETVILTLASGTGYAVGTTTPVTGTITNDDTSITLAVSPASVTEDGTTNLVYTFTRSGVTTNPLTVNYTLGGTATLNTDYTRTGTNNTVTFAANATTATVTVDPTADTIVESNETVILTLAAGTGYTVGTPNAATGTITNDDTSITLAVSPSSVTEDGTTNLIYTFTRNGVTTNSLTVNYTLGGTATLNTDYTRTGTNNTVTFAANATTATVTVDPTADTTVESDETVVLTLASGTGYTVGTTAAVTGTITNDDNSGNNPYILGGYIGSWNLNSNTPIDATFNKLTHLFYSFADVTLNGTVQLPQDGTGTGDIAKLQQIKAQNPNLKIMLSIGGATENDFSSAAATVQSRANFAQSAIQLMKTNGFDGLDIDWEYPEANEDNNYIQLLAQLRQQINQASQNDGKQYLLTTALSGSPYILSASDYGSNPYDFSPQDLKATSDYVDFINVMSYDYHGPWENTTNHQSALYKSTNDNTYNAAKVNTNWAIQHYLSAGVPATDIVLGAPLYGRTWTGVNAGSNNGLFQQGTGSSELTYRELYNLLGTNGYQSFWDNSAKVPYIYSSQTKVFSTYENNQSILGKTDYVKQLGIGGAFFWEITQDLPITHSDSLINAAATNLGINNVVLPTITLAVSPSSVLENGLNNLIYTFTRSGVTTNPLTVNYSISGTATNGSDYTSIPTSVTFAANATTATVIVDPTADTTVESDETVILTLATGTGYTIGTPDAVIGTITNDDLPSITLAISPASVTEDGTSNLIYTFTRTGDTTNPLTVNYTVDGTATNGSDYTSIPTSVTFAANSATATVTVDPTADTTVESDETVILTLAAGTGYTVGTTNPVTGTINNDDFSQLSINNITVVEGLDNNAILTVTVDNPNPQPITFNYTTAPIDATANVDYTSKTGTITIAANTSTATINIPILNDNLNEADEIFTVTLSNPVNATINPEGGIGEVIITDTWQTSLTRTLPNNVENLRLISSNNVNGTGNAGNNKITGNSGINQINGGAGIDTLTGGLGADIFIFQFGQSTISTSDRITDFAINSDKIDLLTQAGNATSAPSNFSRAANSTVTTLDNLINQVFTDANGAITGNQGLAVNSAALVQVTTGAIAGTYLVINDSTAGFQSSNDLLINITGFTGTLPALGNILVGNFFI